MKVLLSQKPLNDKKFGAVIKISCETDFVAKNDEFVAFANEVMDLVLNAKPENIDALNALEFKGSNIGAALTELVGKTGEKMELAGYECIGSRKCFSIQPYGK